MIVLDKQRLIIKGGRRLEGEIALHGAKNSALPILSATVLCSSSECVINNCPRLSDVDAALRIASALGVKCRREGSTVITDASSLTSYEVPTSLMREMRSSIVFLGAILARTGRCRLSFPGGCELGPRPIDLHLSALRQMGAVINEEYGYLDCSCPKGLTGTEITLSFPSVGATENIMLAGVLAKGTTIIRNCAREPEINDLAGFLISCGGKIKGAGSDVIEIEGVKTLTGCVHRVMPDRIAAVTYLCCGAVTGGELIISGADAGHITAVTGIMKNMGCNIYSFGRDKIYITAHRRLNAPSTIRTMPYPGFPTDAQAILMALSTVSRGTGIFVENIFENRYRHVGELCRMGASIRVEGKVAIVEGTDSLCGADVMSTDLRGGAALVVAALCANGESRIGGLHHIDRGYENIEQNLRQVGADIKRI